MIDVDLPDGFTDEVVVAASGLGWIGWVRLRVSSAFLVAGLWAMPDAVLEALDDAIDELPSDPEEGSA